MSNLEMVQNAYEAFGRGDIEGLPYGGAHRGAQAVVDEVFAQIPATYDSFELEPQEWVDGGDTVVTLGRVTIRKDDREAASRVAHVWTLREGRAVRFESFQDSQATARVLGLD
jgi:ketosteroid isomerase-like protein